MKTGSRMAFLLAVCLTLTMFACRETTPIGGSPSSPTQSPTVNAPAQDPVTVTAAPILQDPTNLVNAPVDSELNQEEILQVVRSSLAAYPWRLQQSVFSNETGQTITSLTEVQSSTRGYNRSDQTIGTETITFESILIDQKIYLKITGSPAETYGLVYGQWTELTSESPLAQLVDTSAVDPAKIAEIFATDFASIAGESGKDVLLFEAAGSEDVNGIPTTIYESTGETFTYRWWIGADQRFYRSTVDISQATRTILMEYNPSINIQASLLSVLLLGIMAVAGVVEVITIATAAPGYSGYWTTVTIIPLLAFIYSISRTERLELTAPLTVVIMSLRPDSPDCSTCCSSRSGWAASTCA